MSDEEFQRQVLTELKSLRQELQGKVGLVHQEVVDIHSEMRDGFVEMDKRFEQVDKRFEQVDKQFEQVDKQFEQVDKRFDHIDKRFDSLERHGEENIQATLNVISNKVSDIQEILRSVSEVLGDHELRIRGLVRRPV